MDKIMNTIFLYQSSIVLNSADNIAKNNKSYTSKRQFVNTNTVPSRSNTVVIYDYPSNDPNSRLNINFVDPPTQCEQSTPTPTETTPTPIPETTPTPTTTPVTPTP